MVNNIRLVSLVLVQGNNMLPKIKNIIALSITRIEQDLCCFIYTIKAITASQYVICDEFNKNPVQTAHTDR